MTRGTRRLLIALAISAPASLFIALAMKEWGGPDWVLVVFLTIALCCLGQLLLIADAITCRREAAETDEDSFEMAMLKPDGPVTFYRNVDGQLPELRLDAVMTKGLVK